MKSRGRCVSCELLSVGVLVVGRSVRVGTRLKSATVAPVRANSTSLKVIYDQPSSLLLHLVYGNDPGAEGGA